MTTDEPFQAMYSDMAKGMPRFCICRSCGSRVEVDPSECLRHGWPLCCGKTMYLGTPQVTP